MEWTKKEPPALLHYPVAMRGALPSDSSFVICIEGQGMHEMLQSAVTETGCCGITYYQFLTWQEHAFQSIPLAMEKIMREPAIYLPQVFVCGDVKLWS